MRIYVVEFDNDRYYEDNEHYVVGIFETFKMAENYCLGKGYEKTETEGCLKKKDSFWWNHYNYLTIEGIYLNEIINEVKE